MTYIILAFILGVISGIAGTTLALATHYTNQFDED
jgi:hypothetical protein